MDLRILYPFPDAGVYILYGKGSGGMKNIKVGMKKQRLMKTSVDTIIQKNFQNWTKDMGKYQKANCSLI